MMKATFTSNGSISCVSCIWYSPTWKRCCFVHGFVVASRSSALVRRLATALALALLARRRELALQLRILLLALRDLLPQPRELLVAHLDEGLLRVD